MKIFVGGALIAFAFLISGCVTKTVHVDSANSSAPFDGSAQNPFPTIQQGLDAAANTFGAKVKVRAGNYTEQLQMARNNSLLGDGGVFLRVSGNDPGITVRGNNSITNIRIVPATAQLVGGPGIRWQWDGLGNPDVETTLTIRNCELRGMFRGVEFTTPDTLAFANDALINLRLTADGNWFRNLLGDSINANLRGPTQGSVALHLDVRNNISDGGGTGTGLLLFADERRAGSVQSPSTLIDGTVINNLFISGTNGIVMEAASRSLISPQIVGNTIAAQNSSGIVSSVEGGAFGPGEGLVSPFVERNIIANAANGGYVEFTPRADAVVRRNLFFGNGVGQYVDTTGNNSVGIQNAAGINNLTGAAGNLVADPLFERGPAPIFGQFDNTIDGPGAFFLTQAVPSVSPAVNTGGVTAVDAGVSTRTTRTDLAVDSGQADLGFHFAPP